MARFNEKIHGFLLELLGIYHWEIAPGGKVYIPEDELYKLENRGEIDIFHHPDIMGFGKFEKEIEPLSKMLLEYTDEDVLYPVWKQYFRADEGFYEFWERFCNNFVYNTPPTPKRPVKISMDFYGTDYEDEFKAVKRRFRGSLSTPQGKEAFYKKAFDVILDDAFHEKCYYDFGCMPSGFDIKSIKKCADEDGLTLTIAVYEWMDEDTFEELRERFVNAAVNAAYDEMEIEY